VGIDPVSVKFRNNNELWVVNYISRSISIVELSTRRVAATLQTRHGPWDVVFAGTPERAYVSCTEFNTVQVIDPASFAVVTNLTIMGERPKAMVVSPDASKVYVAILESGNGTTILAPPFTINRPEPGPLGDTNGPYMGQNPPPNDGMSFNPPINPDIPEDEPPPPVSHIVRKNAAGRWFDDNGMDWTEYVSGTNAYLSGRVEGWDLVDRDVAMIDTTTFGIAYIGGLMNICMDLAVNPVTGHITVIGTDATNERRFEPNLRSTFLRVNLALADPASGTSTTHDLNPHLDYTTQSIPASERDLSLGDPRGIAWNSEGTMGYVGGMGSRNVVIIDAEGNRVRLEPIEVEEGPSGLVLDESRQRLYVFNRFSSSLSVVDTTTHTVLANLPIFDPTPSEIKLGRRHLYDTRANSGLGHVSCASCHVDARMDRLAWDLGIPSGDFLTVTNESVNHSGLFFYDDYHPMKGPMVTQTFQDIMEHEPFHWRGDRVNIEAFNITFTDLLGRDSELTESEMAEFKELLHTIHVPPNPFRNLDDTLPASVPLPGLYGVEDPDEPLLSGDPRRGFDMFFFNSGGDNQCRACHERPSGLGRDRSLVSGPNGEAHIELRGDERSFGLPFKVPQLRNIHEKIGLDYDRNNSRTGFGFTHDGRMDTLSKFLFFGSSDPVRYFDRPGPDDDDDNDLDVDRNIADLIAFLLCFSGREPVMLFSTFMNNVRSQGVATASGRQFTTTTPSDPLIDTFLRLADSRSNRLELVVRGELDGLARSWYFAGVFISDRHREDMDVATMKDLPSPDHPFTFMLVPMGLARRLGVDRDSDGWLDRTEMDEGYDPADPNSPGNYQPPRLTLNNIWPIAYYTAHAGMTISFSPQVEDPDTPMEDFDLQLLPAPPKGFSYDPDTGLFAWPQDSLLRERYLTRLYLRVTETSWPFLSDTLPVTLESVPFYPTLKEKDGAGRWTIHYHTIPTWTYNLEYSTNLADEGGWIPLRAPERAGIQQTYRNVQESFPGLPQKYFRLSVEPD